MCKSKLEGGWRCYAHTNNAYIKVQEQIKEAEKELDNKNSVMAQIGFYIEALNTKREDGEVNSDHYDSELARLEGHQEQGRELIRKDREKIESLKESEGKALAEVYTTAKGMKLLKERIDNEENPDLKRNLQVQYNLSKRINGKRKEAFARFKENQAKAIELREQAKAKKEEADAIVPASPDHVKMRDELILEAKHIYAQAYLAKHDGKSEVQALFDANTGQIRPFKFADGKFGKTWVELSDPNNPMSKPVSFLSPPRGKTYESRRAFYESKGLVLGTVWVPGKAEIRTDDYGNKDVKVVRTDGGFSKYCVDGTKDVYAEKIKEEKTKSKK